MMTARTTHGARAAMGEQLSNLITNLRFPLIFLVVMIHSRSTMIDSGYVKENFTLFQTISYFISNIVAGIAVPIFFIISGFLCFSSDKLTFNDYGKLLKKKIRTLLVPYLIWNLIVELFYFLYQAIFQVSSSSRKLVTDYSLSDFVLDFWNGNSGLPICYQMWFVRDLFVCIVFSFFLFSLVRKMCVIVVLFLLLWLFGVRTNIDGLSMDSITFFSLGIALRINKFIPPQRDFAPKYALALWVLALLFSSIALFSKSPYDHGIILKLAILFWLNIAWLCMLSIKKSNLLCRLAKASFFVFASHALIISFFVSVTLRFLPNSDILFCVMYWLYPICTILLCLCIYKIIPNVILKILTGNR